MVFPLWILQPLRRVFALSESFNSELHCNRELEIDIMMVLIFCSLGKWCKEYVIKECRTHQ